MRREQQHNKLVFYRDKLAMSAKILRDDAQLGLLFRSIIMTIETGEQAEFSEDQFIIQTLYDDFIEKLAYNDERWQAATHAKRLGGLLGRSKRDGWNWQQFREKAESEGFNSEEYEKYRTEFAESEQKQEADPYEAESEEMESARAWFRKMVGLFPKNRQMDTSKYPKDKILELYRSYRWDDKMSKAIQMMLDEKGDYPYGAETFFNEKYMSYVDMVGVFGYQ